MFNTNQKKLNQKLQNVENIIDNPTNMEDGKRFWKTIRSNPTKQQWIEPTQ